MLEHSSLPLPLQGVSQKADDLKNPLRVKSQLNMVSSQTKGLTRRLPFEHKATIKNQLPTIDNISKSRMLTKTLGDYELVIGKGVFGVRHNNQDIDPVTYDTFGVASYIESLKLNPDYGKIITLGDSFLVLNKTQIVTTKPDTTYRIVRCNVWVKNMEFGRKITVYSGNIEIGTFTIANGEGADDYLELQPDNVIDRIADILSANSMNVTGKGKGSLGSFTYYDLRVDDGKGGTLISYNNGEVSTTEDLPITAATNTEVLVNPSTKKGEDSSYYVYFNGNTWVESLKGEFNSTGTERYLVTETTMPMKVSRDASGNWSASALDWTMRRVGDIESHPFPNFASGGKTITDFFTYKGRLAIISGENIEFSRIDDYTDFASLTARDSLDDDPIKLRATSNSSQVFKFSAVLDKYCILLTDYNIFIVGSGVEAPFTPSTAQLNNIFTSSERYLCKPEIHGESLLTCSGNSNGSQINQLFIDAYGSFLRNPSLTEHVPSYIGVEPYQILSSHSSNLFFVLTEDEPNGLNICQLKRNTEGAIDQLAWHKWEVGAMDKSLQYGHEQEIVTASIYDNYLYVTFIVNDTWACSRAPLRLDNVDLEDVIYLDHWRRKLLPDEGVELFEVTGNPFGAPGHIVIDYTDDLTRNREGYLLANKESPIAVHNFDDGSVDGYIYNLEDHPEYSRPVIIGIPYESSITTGRIYPRDKEANVLHNVKMQLRWFNVNMTHSGFTYTVTPDAREPRVQYKEPRTVSRYTRQLEQRQFFKGVERVLVGADSRAIDFEFKAHEYHPLVITSLEVAALTSKRGA